MEWQRYDVTASELVEWQRYDVLTVSHLGLNYNQLLCKLINRNITCGMHVAHVEVVMSILDLPHVNPAGVDALYCALSLSVGQVLAFIQCR